MDCKRITSYKMQKTNTIIYNTITKETNEQRTDYDDDKRELDRTDETDGRKLLGKGTANELN
jgi:hypothetical protein